MVKASPPEEVARELWPSIAVGGRGGRRAGAGGGVGVH